MKAEVREGKIVIVAETIMEVELLNYMGFGRLKATFNRVIDERTPDGVPAKSHDEITVEFDGFPPTPV